MDERFGFKSKKIKRDIDTIAGRTDAVDWISKLPLPIMQHILSFLPTKDLARTSILSKTWRGAWASCPVFDFDETYFGAHLPLVNPAAPAANPEAFDGEDLEMSASMAAERKNLEIMRSRDRFMKFVDESLLRICEQKISIEKLRLVMTLWNTELASCVDQWIKFAAENSAKQLIIEIKTEKDISYILPQVTFAAKSITELSLKGCKLENPSVSDNVIIKYSSLRVLRLNKLNVNEYIIQNFIAGCPLIEQFSFMNCEGVKNLQVSGLSKLDKVKVHHGTELERVDIVGFNLQTFWYRGCKAACKINIATCKNLKQLRLDYTIVTGQFFQDFNSKFPLLESLQLHCCDLLETVKISSHQLKRLCLIFCINPVKAYFDAPKLHSFTYIGYRIPPELPIKTSSLQKVKLTLILRNPVDALFFRGLWELLGKFNQISDLMFNVTTPTISFLPDELKDVFSLVRELNNGVVPPFCVLKHLHLDLSSSLNYASLLDGLLWSCHPKILSVVVHPEQTSNKEFVEFLCEKLRDTEENPDCCSSCAIKCWRHYLKDFQIKSFLGTEGNASLHLDAVSALLTNATLPLKIKFLLSWRSHLPKRKIASQTRSKS